MSENSTAFLTENSTMLFWSENATDISALSQQLSIAPLYIYTAEKIVSSAYLLVGGILAIIFNTFSVITIYGNKKFRTSCFTMLAGYSVFASITAYDGARQLNLIFGLSPEMTRLLCYLPTIPKAFGLVSNSILTCFISTDRLLSLVAPVFYTNQRFMTPRKLALPALLLSSCVGLSFVITSYITLNGSITQIIMCPNAAASCEPKFLISLQYHNLIWYGLSVIIYFAIIVSVRIRLYNTTHQHQHNSGAPANHIQIGHHHHQASSNDVTMKTQLNLLPLFRSIMVAQLMLLVAPAFFLSTFSLVNNGRYQPRIILYTGMLMTTSMGADFLVLLAKCKEFRLTLIHTLNRMKKCGKQVTPSSVTH